MADIRPFLDVKLHVTVYFKSRCKNCKTVFRKKVFDYGTLKYKELEQKLDETRHVIKQIICPKCGTENSPEDIVYIDELSNVTITETKINYGNLYSTEDENNIKMEEEHRKRFEIFDEKEEEFWEQYTDYAIANWRDLINELNDFEIEEAFKKMNITSNANTLNKLRREVLNRITIIEEKQLFWRLANDYFIYQHLLDLGAMGWDITKDIKYYGKKRMRFMILHFPLGEATEMLRTEWIGQIIRKNQGDNDFLFRRISMLTDELNRARNKITDYVHQIDEMKVEKQKLENNLHQAYEDIRNMKNKKITYQRDPSDISKIHELKSLVSELIRELKEKDRIIDELKPVEEKKGEIPFLDESVEKSKDDLNILEGKTVVIIGGQRKEQAQKNYVCNVLTHTGETLDPKFYQVLKQADIIVILTQFISHLAMWEAKAFAIENDIPIYYTKGLNITKILYELAEKTN